MSDVTLSEGNSGATKNATFIVTLLDAGGQTVTVDYATADGTATAGSDYTTKTGTLSLTAGNTSKVVTVTVNGDNTDEANEAFFVNLSNTSNASIVDGQGQGTITDDDPAPALRVPK